jgi:hypothetical protein
LQVLLRKTFGHPNTKFQTKIASKAYSLLIERKSPDQEALVSMSNNFLTMGGHHQLNVVTRFS